MILFYLLLAALAALVLVVLLRTAAFKPKAQPADTPEALDYDGQAAIEALGQLVRCKTISYYDKAQEDDGEFEKLIALLPELYPPGVKDLPPDQAAGPGPAVPLAGQGAGACRRADGPLRRGAGGRGQLGKARL